MLRSKLASEREGAYRTEVFVSHQPARDDGFKDRRAELVRLESAVDRLLSGQPKWLALIGPRKIGKTSLLAHLERSRHGPRLGFVLFDVFEASPPSLEIIRSLALRTVDRLLSPGIGASLEVLAGRPAEYRAVVAASDVLPDLPPSLRSTLLALPDARLDPATVHALVDLPEQLALALDRHVILAIDEFQELAGLSLGRGQGDLLPLLRAVWQRHRRVGYVISGSARTMLLELVTSEHSPFFHHFDVMELGPFDTADAVALLVDGAPRERAITVDLARRAVEVFGGHPFYLQLVGEALVEQPGAVDETGLKQAVTDVLFTATGRLSLYFTAEHQRLVGRSVALAAVLDALAREPMRLSELAAATRTATGATAASLNRLGDAVMRDGDRYRIADPVFARWLAWRAPGGAAIPMTTIGDEAEKRVAEELGRLGFDLVYQSRASRGAFDLLAVRGGHLLGVQVKRCRLPATVASAEWKRMEAEAARLGWEPVVAAVVPPDDRVRFFGADQITRERRRLREELAIENLLAWLDRRGPPRPVRRSRRRRAAT